MQVTDEDEYFPPPRNLRDLITAIDAAATFLLGGPVDARPPADDRALHASDVLASPGLSRLAGPEADAGGH